MTPPPPLAVLVCGSVDDGKSTLIGRLLLDMDAIPLDQMAGLDGAAGTPDLSRLTDGLEAERAQGITIDVAHRQFHTGRRRIRLLDCPGHEQYTRNMATAASQAELAVVLVDAAAGVQRQTRRHVLIARLMGVRRVMFVANKMDLVGYDAARFDALAASLARLDPAAAVIPACALAGDGIVRPGPHMGWYRGPTLLQALDAARMPPAVDLAFRMPIQTVLRTPEGGRLLAGTVASGRIGCGDLVEVAGVRAAVRRIAGPAGAQAVAAGDEAVAIELDGAVDAGRGMVVSSASDPAPRADRFQAHLVWCDEAPLRPGHAMLFKLGTATVPGTVERIRHAIDIDTGEKLAAGQLAMNDVAVVELSLSAPIAFEPFATCPALGGFIMLDRSSGATVAAGTIDAALGRAGRLAPGVSWQATTVDGAARAAALRQRPGVLWFTGLSGAGKSTLANRVEALLHAAGRHTYLLDGDNLRHGLCRDLGFTAADRAENVRRVGEVAALMADAGLVVLVCLISPYRADRAAARARTGAAFVEVFVDAPVEECRRRDPKGLYAKADQGVIPEFTGVSAPYEAPEAPDLHVRSDQVGVDAAAEAVVAHVLART